MEKRITMFFMMCTVITAIAQDTQKDFGIKISGYVKNDFFMDTRQTVALREGHYLLWPSEVDMDANNEDINKGLNFNFLAIQSRLSGKINGPDFKGAKTSGLIEADFFAQSNININLLRLRHAFIKLNWEKLEVLTGQYWNPLFVTSCFPGTVSFNTGAPLQSFARNPQFRITYSLGEIKIIGAALAQRDYASRGPNGLSSEYLRNSGIPDIHLQLHYDNETMVGGIGLAYKSLVPRLSSTGTGGTFRIRERINGITAISFAKISFEPITIKAQIRYGQNIPDLVTISGFAIQNVIDPITGEQSYTPLHSLTAWGEFSANISDLDAGIFGGLLLNLGTTDEVSVVDFNNVYGWGTNIATLVRISPRVLYTINKVRLAGEIEYTMAAFGSNYDVKYKPSDVDVVGNIRVLLALYYFF